MLKLIDQSKLSFPHRQDVAQGQFLSAEHETLQIIINFREVFRSFWFQLCLIATTQRFAFKRYNQFYKF